VPLKHPNPSPPPSEQYAASPEPTVQLTETELAADPSAQLPRESLPVSEYSCGLVYRMNCPSCSLRPCSASSLPHPRPGLSTAAGHRTGRRLSAAVDVVAHAISAVLTVTGRCGRVTAGEPGNALGRRIHGNAADYLVPDHLFPDRTLVFILSMDLRRVDGEKPLLKTEPRAVSDRPSSSLRELGR
jgi:hypothetical protein